VLAPSEIGKRHESGQPGAGPSAEVIRLRYVCERNHLPVAHGDLEFNLTQASWLRTHDDPRVQKMAECFLEAQLKKRESRWLENAAQ
jgi:hypothetical protein